MGDQSIRQVFEISREHYPDAMSANLKAISDDFVDILLESEDGTLVKKLLTSVAYDSASSGDRYQWAHCLRHVDERNQGIAARNRVADYSDCGTFFHQSAGFVILSLAEQLALPDRNRALPGGFTDGAGAISEATRNGMLTTATDVGLHIKIAAVRIMFMEHFDFSLQDGDDDSDRRRWWFHYRDESREILGDIEDRRYYYEGLDLFNTIVFKAFLGPYLISFLLVVNIAIAILIVLLLKSRRNFMASKIITTTSSPSFRLSKSSEHEHQVVVVDVDDKNQNQKKNFITGEEAEGQEVKGAVAEKEEPVVEEDSLQDVSESAGESVFTTTQEQQD